jgi:hypothetical protein
MKKRKLLILTALGLVFFFTSRAQGSKFINDSDPGIVYHGSFFYDGGNSLNINNDVHYTNVLGDYIEYAFNGTGIRYIGEKVFNRGKSEVFIDGISQGIIDAYDPGILYQQILFTKEGLISGTHTIRIVCYESGKYTDIDGFLVSTPGVINGSFETPDATAGNVGLAGVLMRPVTSDWVFSGNAAIMKNGCAYGPPNAPDGLQCAAIQNGGNIYQVVNLTAGKYVIYFSSAQRGSNPDMIPINISVDGVKISTLTSNTTATYTLLSTAEFTVTDGVHTIDFSSTATGTDNTVFFDNVQIASPWDNRPATTFGTKYSQAFNTVWDNTKFYDQWETVDANAFGAADITAGYLQFSWIPKRVICSKNTYASPYVIESDIDYSAGSSRGGVILRVDPVISADETQSPALGDPGFNREGIAFYPNDDGSSMTVQFTGANNGNSTPVTRISVPKPFDVASLRDRGTLRVEDYGTSVYMFYNNAPYIRIDLGGLTGANYTSGTVYNAAMQVAGTFTGMEVAVLGKVAVAQRDAALRLYSVAIKGLATASDAPTDVTAVSGSKKATVSFSAPLNDGGSVITQYTVISSPGNFKQTGTSSPLVVTRLANGTAYTFTVIATNVIGNSVASAPSNSVTPATTPDAPTDVIASASNKQASVSFTAPVVSGGSDIINYTVTSTPGNLTQTGTASPLVLTGLDNGTAYTFTVVATNLVGNSIESAISNEVTPVDNTALKENQHSAIRVYQSGSALVVDLNGLSGLQNVYLTDVLGKPVVSRKAYGGEKLAISNRLLSGVYFVRVQGTNKTQVTKVIVK